MSRPTDRRTFLRASGLTLAAAALSACGRDTTAPRPGTPGSGSSGAQPAGWRLQPVQSSRRLRWQPGLRPLGSGQARDGSVYVPPGLRGPAMFVVSLHGAGGMHRSAMRRFHALRRHDLVILAVDSRGITWDHARGGAGSDAEFIDRAVQLVSRNVPVDPDRVFLSGFSDGASYTLSFGLDNGDRFRGLLAFSPGYMAAEDRRGKPAVFVAHGRDDGVLPYGNTANDLVPELRDGGYDVTLHSFDGRHEAGPDIAAVAMRWVDELV